MAPTNSSRQAVVSAFTSMPRKVKVIAAFSGAAANTSSKPTAPKITKVAMMPSAKPKSPTRLTRNALMAAALADGLSYQKPISR